MRADPGDDDRYDSDDNSGIDRGGNNSSGDVDVLKSMNTTTNDDDDDDDVSHTTIMRRPDHRLVRVPADCC